MVEVYIKGKRRPDLESQLTKNWDISIPQDISECRHVLAELEGAVDKLVESNKAIAESMEDTDSELDGIIEENCLVIRRKQYQIEHLRKHLEAVESK